MKKKQFLKYAISVIFAASVITSLCTWASASSTGTYGVLTYEINNGEISITDCSESAEAVDIPSEIDSYTVTAIKEDAFRDCSLTQITISDSIKSIGSAAFFGCSNLTSISIPNSVTSIGSSAFERCLSLTSVTIGTGVTSIGDYAFNRCKYLTNIIIPNSVTSIGAYAFEMCYSLESIAIPDSVYYIGYNAFYGCGSLSNVNITDIAAWCDITFSSKTSNPLFFAENLYLNNTLITDLIIPDIITHINAAAFYGWENLTSISIPDSVASIGNSAFNACTGLTTVYYNGTSEQFSGISIGSDNAYFNSAEKIYLRCAVTLIDENGNLTTLTTDRNSFLDTSPIEKYGHTLKIYTDKEHTSEFDLSALITEDCTLYYSNIKKPVSLDTTVTTAFSVNPVNAEKGDTIILALYDNEKFLEIQTAKYNGDALSFTTNKKYTAAKIMAWKSLSTLIPICEPIIIK